VRREQAVFPLKSLLKHGFAMLSSSSVFVQCLFQHLAALGELVRTLGEPLADLVEPRRRTLRALLGEN